MTPTMEPNVWYPAVIEMPRMIPDGVNCPTFLHPGLRVRVQHTHEGRWLIETHKRVVEVTEIRDLFTIRGEGEMV